MGERNGRQAEREVFVLRDPRGDAGLVRIADGLRQGVVGLNAGGERV